MARVYSRRKGKSGSKRPSKIAIPSWIRYKPKEIELLVIKLSKEGKTPSQIGLILRDTYGIPDARLITKKSISKTLKDKNVLPKLPENLSSLMTRVIKILRHMEENKKDMTAKRGLQITESKIRRLVKYYKAHKMLPQEWNYDRNNVSLLLE